jgi:hypothetical protein
MAPPTGKTGMTAMEWRRPNITGSRQCLNFGLIIRDEGNQQKIVVATV